MGSPTSLACRQHAALQPEGALLGLLGQPAGLRDCLWISPCLSPCCQIHLTYQRDWKPLPGAGDSHDELPHLQVRPRRCQQESGGTSFQGFPGRGHPDPRGPADKRSGECWRSHQRTARRPQGHHPHREHCRVRQVCSGHVPGQLPGQVDDRLDLGHPRLGRHLLPPKDLQGQQAKIDEALMPLLSKYEELAGKVSAALPASVTGKKEEWSIPSFNFVYIAFKRNTCYYCLTYI